MPLKGVTAGWNYLKKCHLDLESHVPNFSFLGEMVWIWLTDKEFQHPRLNGVVVNREQILCLSTKSRPFHLGS